jgi:small-conductance mechanosensitive channel
MKTRQISRLLRCFPRWGRHGFLMGMACLLFISLSVGEAAIAEVPPTGPKLPVLQKIQEVAPPDLQRWLDNNGGQLQTAPVFFDGELLFYVTSPTSEDAAEPVNLTAQQRATEIEQRLQRMVLNGISSEAPSVTWQLDESSNQPVIYVDDNLLMTVTSLDAQMQGHSFLKERAEQLTRTIRQAIVQYYQQRQAGYLWKQLRLSGIVAVVAAMVVWLLALLHRWLKGRRQALSELLAEGDPLPENAAVAPEKLTTALQLQMTRRTQQGMLDLQRMGVRALQGLVVSGSVYFVLGRFPYTRWLQPWLLEALQLPVKLGLLVLVTYWLLRFGNVWIDRLLVAIQEGASMDLAAVNGSQRLGLRFSTFSHVVKNVLAFLTLMVSGIVGLSILGVQIAPLLTGAGIVGLAISLASQNLIQDFINGFFILLEDQYSVGDVIVVEDVWGFVETMNLRTTQLRNEEGRLITIPNSKIGIVQNLSKEWSRVDLSIPVAHTADINRALRVIETVAVDMQQEAIWGQLILEPPLLLGVDHLDHIGATIRIWIKTLPLKQWDVAREYRRRLKMAFDEANIAIGIPQQLIQISSPVHPSGFRSAESYGHGYDDSSPRTVVQLSR